MRVIAGRLGGRRLAAPRGLATRPTSDRVREALFSRLGPIEGAVVADLYAGTGALGIEALSRQAARAVFVESSRAALGALRGNLAALGLGDSAAVLAAPVERSVGELAKAGPFDLVFIDPPYATVPALSRLLDALAERCLSPGALVVVEHASRDAPPAAAALELAGTRAYGDSAITFYRPKPSAG